MNQSTFIDALIQVIGDLVRARWPQATVLRDSFACRWRTKNHRPDSSLQFVLLFNLYLFDYHLTCHSCFDGLAVLQAAYDDPELVDRLSGWLDQLQEQHRQYMEL